MTVAAAAIGQMPIGADDAPARLPRKAPRLRTATATADPVLQPEAR